MSETERVSEREMTPEGRVEAGARGKACDLYTPGANVSGRCTWCSRHREDHALATPETQP